MPSLPDIIALVPAIPLTHVIAIVSIGSLALAFFTVHAILTIAREKQK